MPLYPVNAEIHWLAHGTYLMPSAKLHQYLSPQVIANFIGFDLASHNYEDIALTTIPAFWINPAPEVYQPTSGWRHPWYDPVRFSGVIPTLRDWLDWLDYNSRQIWKHSTTRQQIAVPACMVSPGHHYRKVVVAQGSLVPGRKVTGSVGNLSSLASYYILVYTCR